MPVLQEYKCPCCGGAITFDSRSQNMKCPYCDTEFDLETLAAYDAVLNSEPADDMKWQASGGTAWEPQEQDVLRTYVCQSCGGELVTDANTAATTCPYCGNPVVLMERLAGGLKPDCVIPFQLTKEDAIAALSKHYTGKPLLPKVFKDENHIREVKGIYVPFWLYDADVDATIRYRATRTRVWSDSNYNYTETRYYSVLRAGRLGFDHVPVDSSSKMPNDLMESIEPYDFSQAVDFQTAYLAGYLADKYDVTAENSVERANARIRQSTEDTFRDTVVGYSSVMPEHTGIRLENGKAKYALYPVWLLTTKWKDQTYTFAMNGQTGRLAGDLPMDKGAFCRWFFGLLGGVAAAVFAITQLIGYL